MKIIIAENFRIKNDTNTLSYSQFKKGDIYEVIGINKATTFYDESVVVLQSTTENKLREIASHVFDGLHMNKKFYIFE